ncbi:HIT domain-containing protein [soil metagenome]
MRDYDGTEYPDDQLEPSTSFAAVADGMQRLWTPHRIAYIEQSPQEKTASGCVFCDAPAKSDEEALIVHRGETGYVLLNLFPYNSGHLLVVPYRHVSTYDLASTAETAEIASMTQSAMRALSATSHPHGFNIGMNQGAVAGAGIAEHLHQHVVPRWASDANFMPIIAQTKAIPKLLGEAREELAKAWKAH